jgi:hypothetical protein
VQEQQPTDSISNTTITTPIVKSPTDSKHPPQPLTPEQEELHKQLHEAYDKYVGQKVAFRISSGKFVGKVIGVDPRPKPDVVGAHYTEGIWLCIRCIADDATYYALANKVTIL